MPRTPAPALICCALWLSGCCYTPRAKDLADRATPMHNPSGIEGTYDDEQGALWTRITAQQPRQAEPPGTRQTRLLLRDGFHLTCVRLINGAEIRRRDLSFKFNDGYVVVHHPSVLPLVVVTTISCSSTVLAADRVGDLALYRKDDGIIFLTVIPLVPDYFPRWEEYPRSPGG